MSHPPFHLAFPVINLSSIREFYTKVLGCEVGRESDKWIDFNFFGHQITAHVDETILEKVGRNSVDNKAIPARHFGAILEWSDWDELVDRLSAYGIEYYLEPYTRFKGEPGEQRTFFILDPSDNYLEFKCFKDNRLIFQSD